MLRTDLLILSLRHSLSLSVCIPLSSFSLSLPLSLSHHLLLTLVFPELKNCKNTGSSPEKLLRARDKIAKSMRPHFPILYPHFPIFANRMLHCLMANIPKLKMNFVLSDLNLRQYSITYTKILNN